MSTKWTEDLLPALSVSVSKAASHPEHRESTGIANMENQATLWKEMSHASGSAVKGKET